MDLKKRTFTYEVIMKEKLEVRKELVEARYRVVMEEMSLLEKQDQLDIEITWIEGVLKKVESTLNQTDIKTDEQKKNEEEFKKEYSGNEKREFQIYHKNFSRYRKFDLWSIGCLIYYAMKEEFPWVDFKSSRDTHKETISLKTAEDILEHFKYEMTKEPSQRRFFISEDDLPKSSDSEIDENREVFEIARKCLSGEITKVEEILGKREEKKDSEKKHEDDYKKSSSFKEKKCFNNLHILSNFIKKGEVHYDFNAACAKMVYNIQELVKAYNRLQEKNIYEPNLMAEIMREI